MRKPTAKMIEALVDLFEQNGGGVDGHRINTGTLCGLLDRGLVRGGQTYAHPVYLTDAGLAFLVDTRRAVVASDGSYICGNREPLTEDQVTAELIRFESDRALDAETLAKAIQQGWQPPASLGVSGEDRSEPTPAPEPVADAARCDRLTDHAGFCLKRCTKTPGCTERARHRGKCTTGLWSPIAQSWASTGDTRCTNPGHDAAACDTCRTEASERVSTGLIDATAMMLTEGRGSAITNLPNGSHAWTPVDRESEFDQAARRSPESAWERPAAGHLADAAGALFPDAATPAKLAALGFDVSDYDATKPPVTGFLPSINQALTPGEVALLDGIDTPEVSEGDWLASVNGSNRVALRLLIDRGLAYVSHHSVHLHHYVTAVGASLVTYRRNIAAAKARHAAQGNETPDRVDAYITRAFSTGPAAISDTQHASDLAKATGAVAVTVEQVRDGQVVSSTTASADGPMHVAVDPTQAARELISGGPNATLTIQRLRRGLALTQADRVALAGLLDTVRRSVVDLDRTAGDSGMHARRKGLEFDRIERIYRAHFGDPR